MGSTETSSAGGQEIKTTMVETQNHDRHQGMLGGGPRSVREQNGKQFPYCLLDRRHGRTGRVQFQPPRPNVKLPRTFSELALWKQLEGLFGQTSGGWLAGWLGNEGERLAARYLRRQGYKSLARRDRTALGEIDLIARGGACNGNAEEKTPRSDAARHPPEAVDMRQQRLLTRP